MTLHAEGADTDRYDEEQRGRRLLRARPIAVVRCA